MAKIPEFSKADLNPVGMVVYSRLTESQFQALNGTNWILYDGRDISGSKLAAELGITNLEDARGLVLRGKNNGRNDGNEDPDGERVLGSFQDDAMQGHLHEIEAMNDSGASFITSDTGLRQGQALRGVISPNPVREPVSDGVNGAPKTAAESRMRNLAVNTFIKIN